MRRETAIKNAAEVARRIRQASGCLGTPGFQFEALRIRRAWVFGSTIKGSQNPNDVDILLDCEPCGRHFRVGKGAMLDKERKRRHGYRLARDTLDGAIISLRQGMKGINIHTYQNDGELAHPRVMIWPRNEFTATHTTKEQ